jgi:hypothetical protein
VQNADVSIPRLPANVGDIQEGGGDGRDSEQVHISRQVLEKFTNILEAFKESLMMLSMTLQSTLESAFNPAGQNE